MSEIGTKDWRGGELMKDLSNRRVQTTSTRKLGKGTLLELFVFIGVTEIQNGMSDEC
jgi:hypothetical protein